MVVGKVARLSSVSRLKGGRIRIETVDSVASDGSLNFWPPNWSVWPSCYPAGVA